MFKNKLLKRISILFVIFIFSFFVGINTIHAQDSKCFNKTNGQFTSWAECLGGISQKTTIGTGYTDNVFINNPLYAGFVENFYMSYFNKEYVTACGGLLSTVGLNCSNDGDYSALAAVKALNKTTNRIIADVSFLAISAFLLIFAIKLFLALMKYGSAADNEEIIKTQKKVIKSMLFAFVLTILFLIIAQFICISIGVGNFWEVGFKLKII